MAQMGRGGFESCLTLGGGWKVVLTLQGDTQTLQRCLGPTVSPASPAGDSVQTCSRSQEAVDLEVPSDHVVGAGRVRWYQAGVLRHKDG